MFVNLSFPGFATHRKAQAEGAKHAARTPGSEDTGSPHLSGTPKRQVSKSENASNAQDAAETLQQRIDKIIATRDLNSSMIRRDTDMNDQIAAFIKERLHTILANHKDPKLSELERRIVPESIDSIIAFITDPTNVRTKHTADIAEGADLNLYGLDLPNSGSSKSTRALCVGTLNLFQFRLVPTENRLKALVALLMKQNIDILGVTEATTNTGSNPDIKSLAKEMNMEIVVHERTGIQNMFNALLVRIAPHLQVNSTSTWFDNKSEKKEARSAVCAEVVYNGNVLKLVCTHLAFQNENIRMAQYNGLRQMFPPTSSESYILMGDFNAINEKDYTQAGWEVVTQDRLLHFAGTGVDADGRLLKEMTKDGNAFHDLSAGKFRKDAEHRRTTYHNVRVDYILGNSTLDQNYTADEYTHHELPSPEKMEWGGKVYRALTDHFLVTCKLTRKPTDNGAKESSETKGALSNVASAPQIDRTEQKNRMCDYIDSADAEAHKTYPFPWNDAGILTLSKWAQSPNTWIEELQKRFSSNNGERFRIVIEYLVIEASVQYNTVGMKRSEWNTTQAGVKGNALRDFFGAVAWAEWVATLKLSMGRPATEVVQTGVISYDKAILFFDASDDTRRLQDKIRTAIRNKFRAKERVQRQTATGQRSRVMPGRNPEKYNKYSQPAALEHKHAEIEFGVGVEEAPPKGHSVAYDAVLQEQDKKETNDEEMLERLQHKWKTVSARERVHSRTYLFTKIGKGKGERYADTPKETTDFVIAILGLTDGEVENRKKDLATLIRNVNKESPTRPVTFVLYDTLITTNKVTTTMIDETLPAVTIVAVRPTFHKETPMLSSAMNAAHELTQSRAHPLGKRADFALSDYSSPAWCVNHNFLSVLAPFLRVNGKLLVLNQELPQGMFRSGGTYYQDMTAWQKFYKTGGFKVPVDEIDNIVSPLPHNAIKQKYHTHSPAKEEKTVDEQMLDLLERLFGPNSQEGPITRADLKILQELWEEGSNFAEGLFLPTREQVKKFQLRDGPLEGPGNNKWRQFPRPRMKNSDIPNIFNAGGHWPKWRIYLQYKWKNSHLNPKKTSLPVSSNAFAGGSGATSDEHIQQKHHGHSVTEEKTAVELFSHWMLVFMKNERTITKGAKGPVKQLHWFWWVFPNTVAGQYDTFKVRFSTEEMKAVLKLKVRPEWELFLKKWSQIGKKITDGRLKLPIKADSTRLHFFKEEWKKALEEVPNDGVYRVRHYFAKVLHFDSKSARQKKI